MIASKNGQRPAGIGIGPPAFLVLLTVIAACTGDLSTFPLVAGGSVAAVTIELSSPNLVVGLTTQAEATVKSASGAVLTGRAISWQSSNTAIATIAPDGVVTALQPGATTLTASTGGKSGTAQLTVTRPAVAVVTLTPTNGVLVVGASGQVGISVQDAAGTVLTGRAVSWSSANSAVATVSQSGVVTAIQTGTATISATSEGVTGRMTVTVTSVPVASVTLSPSAAALTVGDAGYYVVTVKDVSGNVLADRVVTWTSSAPAIASVASDGLVSGLSPGTATVTATSEGKSGSATVTVTTRSGGGTADACSIIAGGKIVASDGAFLGSLTNKYNSQSVLNPYGTYGSKYSSLSIWNNYGEYGSPYATKSAFNRYTTTPPRIILRDGQTWVWLTVNQYIGGVYVNPYLLPTCTNFP